MATATLAATASAAIVRWRSGTSSRASTGSTAAAIVLCPEMPVKSKARLPMPQPM
ncbi:hypothetical protein D3C86_1404140 [compost metagenome]